MRRKVVVTGMGCISPVGITVKETWDSLLAGQSGAGPITFVRCQQAQNTFRRGSKGLTRCLCLHREARKMDRFTHLPPPRH